MSVKHGFRILNCFDIFVLGVCTLGATLPEVYGLYPVIFAHGFGGCQMQANIYQKQSVVNPLCLRRDSNYTIWLDFPTSLQLVNLFGSVSEVFGDCWADNMKLVYNTENRTTSDSPGVTIHPPEFGKCDSVDYLHSSTTLFRVLNKTPISYLLQYYEYLKKMIDALVKIGLKRDVSIKAATYDFRKAPNESKEYFIKLKTLIEETYNANGDSPCVLVGHSMGAPMMLYFLHQQSQEWKDKYIKSLVGLGANWGGCVKPLKVYCEGDDFGVSILKKETVRHVVVTCPTLAWQCPTKKYWGDELLVSTSKKNYTLNNLNEFFNDLELPTASLMYEDILPDTEDLSAPGVEVHCLCGSNIPTIERIHYSGDLINRGTSSFDYGPGDGTVNMRSLRVCQEWVTTQTHKVVYKEYPGIGHLAIIKDDNVIDYICNVAKGSV